VIKEKPVRSVRQKSPGVDNEMPSTNVAQKRMNSMPLSESSAIWLNDLSNLFLIISLVAGVVSTGLIVWTGGIKDGYLQQQLATEHERAARLENDAAQARLELEKLKAKVGPRTLDREAFQTALMGQPRAPIEILYLKDDADSLEFAQEIENDLKQASWHVVSRAPIPTQHENSADADVPTAMSMGGQPSGVTVVAHSVSMEESEAVSNSMTGRDWIKTPYTALTIAFQKSMGQSSGSGFRSCPEGILRVVVAPKR
jgi:hypothetical protein